MGSVVSISQLFGIGLLLSAFVLAGCRPTDDPIPPEMVTVFAEEVDVELTVRARPNAMDFVERRIEAPAGARVRLVMDNTETVSPAMVHNLVVLASVNDLERIGLAAHQAPGNVPDDPAVLANTPLTAPGTKTAVVFTMPPPGDYPFICTYPGHFRAMQGRLISTP